MGRPEPISDAERARVAELHAQGMSRAEIARTIGRAASTVGKIAERLGLTWSREKTVAATAARQADLASRRAELAAILLDDAFKLRERVWSRYTLTGFSRDGEPVTVDLSLPPAADTRNLVTALAVVVDKHLALIRADTDSTGRAAVDAWLREMLGGTP